MFEVLKLLSTDTEYNWKSKAGKRMIMRSLKAEDAHVQIFIRNWRVYSLLSVLGILLKIHFKGDT